MSDDRPHEKNRYFSRSGTYGSVPSVGGVSERATDAKTEFKEVLSQKSRAYGTVTVRTVKKRYAAGKD